MADAERTWLGWLGVGAMAVSAMVLGGPAPGRAASLPDLNITALTNPPKSALPGESFAVTATVKNRGSAAAAASSTAFSLLSTDGKITKPLKGLQALPSLAAGAVANPAATVAIPTDTVAGVYYLQACADGGNVVAEASEVNNCRKTSEKITVLALPDLVVTALGDPPAAIAPGRTFDVSTTVKNTGALPAVAATTRYALISTETSARVEVDGTQAVPALGPGASFTDTETLTVRAATALGAYRLEACADSGKAVTESDEADNCLLSAGVVLVTIQPDLVIASLAVGSSLSVPPGGTFKATAVSKNNGAGDAAASRIRFELVDAAGGAIVPLTGTQAVPVLAGGASTQTQTTVTVPADTPLGTYTAQACIDAANVVQEAAEGNNCTSAPGSVKVAIAVPKPDLVVTSVTAPPATMLPTQTFETTAVVTNQGAGPSDVSATKFYVVAPDNTRKNLKGVQAVGALAAGASDGPTVTLKVYSDTVPGTYVFQACADGDGNVAESSESNNCLTLPGSVQILASPDLAVTAVSDPPATATQGQAIAVTATVKNLGAVTAGESTSRYYMVAVDGSGKIDTKGKPILPAIEPGNSFTEKDTVTVRLETAPGDYYLQACADSKKVLAEKNEDNNCLTSVKTIKVTPRPNLIVKSVALKDPQPIVVALGGVISIEVVVANDGPGPAGESELRIFLVDQSSPLTKDLKGHPKASALAPTKTTTVKGTVKVFMDTVPGVYGVRACADYNELVAETNEDDNCALAQGTLTVQ